MNRGYWNVVKDAQEQGVVLHVFPDVVSYMTPRATLFLFNTGELILSDKSIHVLDYCNTNNIHIKSVKLSKP